MKKVARVALIAVAVLLLSAPQNPSDAWRGHGHGHGHGHGGVRSRVFIGTGFWLGPPYWWYYPYPSYVYPAPVVIQQEPPVYVQQPPPEEFPAPPAAPAESFWYYCQSAKGYYPSVQQCPEAWIKVPPTAP